MTNKQTTADTGATIASDSTNVKNKAIEAKNNIARELRDNATDPYHSTVDRNTLYILLRDIEAYTGMGSEICIQDIIENNDLPF